MPRNEEIYHLWMASAPERHARLDALFLERLQAHDTAGCQALLDAVVEAGGEGDPLLALCRGIMANELTRDWGAAEAHFHQVLEHPQVEPSLRSRAMMALGLVDRYQGRYHAALHNLEECCRVAEAAGDFALLAKALRNRGIACTEGWMKGQLPRSALDDALACHLRSKDISQRCGETELGARAWNNIGAVYKEMGRLDEALAAYRSALALAPPAQRYVRNAITHNIAEVEELQGHWAEAQAAYGEVLATYREIAGDYEVAGALLNLGSVQERRGLTDAAMVSYQEAVAAVESIRARLKAEEARAGFLGTRLAPYERLIALSCSRPGGEGLAFDMVERAKARAFIELLAGRPLRPPRAVPKRLLRREQSLRGGLSHLYRMGPPARSADPVSRRIGALETELEDVYRQMRRLDAQYAGCRTVDPLPLAEVHRRLPPGATLLEYFGTGDEIGCFVINRATAGARMLPGAGQAVRRHLALGDSASMDSPAGDGRGMEADDLYGALLAPIDGLLDGCEQLYIVPHGLLHYVPLHALGDGAPLLQRHRVAYAPSASILLRDREGPAQARRQDCLALGFNGTNLRFAELEARCVASATGGVAHLGADATAEALYREGPSHRTLHLACHGTFNPQAPLASGLMLADGKLDAMSILQGLRLSADLVVLSACDTGRAAVLRGDELMGLARSILYAGASAVLVSLWPVDDLATALLMDAFYRARIDQPPGPDGIAEALRQAQLALRAMSIDEALAACERLRAVDTSGDGGAAAWADAALASLQAAAGEAVGARCPALAGRGAHLARWIGAARPAPRHARKPYEHPYYWAAFSLICGSVPLPPLHSGKVDTAVGDAATA
ncbi:MAG: CHAT domain-containing protein [Chloroflexi bacterium]|nr:CHAT domain-containing protein [Chloroflexota bacterium]